MNREVNSIVRLAAVALLVGVAAIGCAGQRGAGASQPAQTPATQQSQAAAATPTLTPTPAAQTTSPTPAQTVSPTPTATARATSSSAATPDPLDGQLSNIQNLLNGMNSSLSGSDAGTTGGE